MKVAIIGLGLIGSSIARAVMRAETSAHILAVDASDDVLKQALEHDLCHATSNDIHDITEDFDFIILATPLSAIVKILPEAIDLSGPKTIVLDVGSVKSVVYNRLLEVRPEFNRFIPAHPMAGSHLAGPLHGRSDMFDSRKIILTPPETVDEDACRKTVEFFEMLGADVVSMAPDAHDEIMAYVSHLPHLLAFSYMKAGTEFKTDEGVDYIDFCAGGFYDFTRIAQSDPAMWVDIFEYNKGKILKSLKDVLRVVNDFVETIENSDSERVMQTINLAKNERQKLR
ncbi:cyclohexadieny/prephenate dehydrogenase [Litorimonas taeanensis]|uniref:Cyclohexadieny/prephenate dehydrogenase n=1 Tax=Litorimonas taeanensis TaxID=568099 RepID=A0A420WCZ0_9PROT|nr:prephenate dehydrogenase [Litorimonas taeanensis]RKQ68838.1 cyclohexadieny/prephenate dehydrogenase [Litorimonas taeanensis]